MEIVEIKRAVSTVIAAVNGQAKGIEAIRTLVSDLDGVKALSQAAERFADVGGKPSCDEVKRLRALIRKAGTFIAASDGTYAEAESGDCLTVKFAKGCAVIAFAKANGRTEADPVAKALKAYIKACRESTDGIDLDRAVAMLTAEWQDVEEAAE